MRHRKTVLVWVVCTLMSAGSFWLLLLLLLMKMSSC